VEVILEEFEDASIPIHAVWPASKTPPAKTRLFVDALVARLRHERL
jgi:DNA-binding transcriptional LysR family regulator